MIEFKSAYYLYNKDKLNSWFRKVTGAILLAILFLIPSLPVAAQEFSHDLSISLSDIRVGGSPLRGKEIRIYVTVHNNSHFDLSGVVKFYNERTSSFISADQPISVLAGKTDDVFVDWTGSVIGEHPIAIRVVPWNSQGDDPSNNKVIKSVIVDTDSDRDGVGDFNDPDDDNDGVPDNQDAFPYDSSESSDIDGDGIGDNADEDDDGDGVNDVEDVFPQHVSETKDTDGDGVGDNGDLFPFDVNESADADGDGLGDNADPNDENHGPIPFIITSDSKVRVGKSMTFSALKSRDPDGEIENFEWDFGDGMTDTGVIVDHVFETTGAHIVSLKVTDDKGEYRQQQLQIVVSLDYLLMILIISTVFLILLILGLVVPGSRFHHKKMRIRWK